MSTVTDKTTAQMGGAGKAPLKIEGRRTRVTPIRLTPEEYAEFVEASSKLGLTPSDYIRTAGLNALVGGVSTDKERTQEVRKIHAELGKQGALLSHIAKVLNYAVKVQKQIAENKDEEKRAGMVTEMLDKIEVVREDLIAIRQLSAELTKGRMQSCRP